MLVHADEHELDSKLWRTLLRMLSGSKACFGGKHLGTKPLIMAKSRLSWHKAVYLGTKPFILAQSRSSWHKAVHLGAELREEKEDALS